MAAYSTEKIAPRYHDAIVAWQKKNFPELEFLEKNWDRHFGSQTPFQLVAKVGKLQTEAIQYARFLGKPKFEKAGEMTGQIKGW